MSARINIIVHCGLVLLTAGCGKSGTSSAPTDNRPPVAEVHPSASSPTKVADDPALSSAEDKPKILSKAIDSGQLMTTSKIGLSDGLFLSLSFVVIDPSQPDARKLNGMAGLAFIENLPEVKDHQLSRRSRVKFVRGGREFSLTQPQVKNREGVTCLDYASFSATALYNFLQSEGKLSVVVDGTKHELSADWSRHVDDLIKEVQSEREIAGYKR